MTVRRILAVLFASLAAGLISVAAAQDLETYQQRQRDLNALATLFGEMHHLRRTCEPQFEADVWRERMQKLLELEEPQDAEREALVQGFNQGYRDAQRRYPSCDRRARDYAASRAAKGDVIVARLTQALRQEQEDDGFANSPYVITPTTD